VTGQCSVKHVNAPAKTLRIGSSVDLFAAPLFFLLGIALYHSTATKSMAAA
jgi:hypothetical protein